MRIDGTPDVLAQRPLERRAAVAEQAQMRSTVLILNHELALEPTVPDQLGPGIVDLHVERKSLFNVRLRVEATRSAGAAVKLHGGPVLHDPASAQAAPASARACRNVRGATHGARPPIGPWKRRKKWRSGAAAPTFLGIDVALQQGSRALAEEIAALIESLDFDALVPEVVHAQVQSLRRRLKTMTRRASKDEDLSALIDELKATLAEYTPDANTWEALKSDLTEAYESLTSILTADDPDKPARPINYTRSIFHAGCGVVSLLLALVFLPMHQLVWVAGAVAAWGWTAEILRRVSPRANAILMRGFKHVAHPSEWNRVNSATWYSTALLALTLTGSIPLMVVPVAVLAFGDPAAGILGRKYGRTPLIHGRSLEGTAAFVVVASLAAAATLVVARPEFGFLPIALISASAGMAGAMAELFSRSIDDNLSVPAAALAMTFATMAMLGLS
jgi:dolichol kinase